MTCYWTRDGRSQTRNAVCESPAMTQYLACAHEWSLYSPEATADPEWSNVTHAGGAARVCPAVCTSDSYDFAWRCDRAPKYRGELHWSSPDIENCELWSIVYDIVLGALSSALMVGFAYATNSYRVLVEKADEEASGGD